MDAQVIPLHGQVSAEDQRIRTEMSSDGDQRSSRSRKAEDCSFDQHTTQCPDEIEHKSCALYYFLVLLDTIKTYFDQSIMTLTLYSINFQRFAQCDNGLLTSHELTVTATIKDSVAAEASVTVVGVVSDSHG